MPEEQKNNRSDHDLLVSVSTKLDRAIEDIKELKDGMASRVAALEQKKFDTEEAIRIKGEDDKVHSDHENRLRVLEQWGWKVVGAIAIIEPLVAYLIAKYAT